MTMDSQSANVERRISDALAEIEQTSQHQTDGKWLEYLTRDCAPLIAARNTFPRRWASDTFNDLFKGRVEPSQRGKKKAKKTTKKPTANREAG